jgi:radical SAM-linked protein
MNEVGFRLRVRYSKTGRLRFLSHLEVIRSQERLIRRADLPYAITNGFAPHMKVAFGPALGVGTGGLEEYLDVWLTSYLDADEALERLQASASESLFPTAAAYVPPREPSLTAWLTISRYRVICTGAPAGDPCEASALPSSELVSAVEAAMQGVCARGSIEVARKKPNKSGATTRTLDLSRLLFRMPRAELPSEADVCGLGVPAGKVVAVELWTRFDERGALRPEVFLAAVGEQGHLSLRLHDIMRLEQLHEEEDGTLRKPLE